MGVRKLSEDQLRKARERANKRRLADPKRHADEVRAHRLANPEKYREYDRKWREKNPEHARQLVSARQRKLTYGIDSAEYDRMLAEQDGSCAICLKKRKLVIDHDHATGVIRGLLCHWCNLMLGNAHDSPAILQAGRVYLKRAKKLEQLSTQESLPLFKDVRDA